MVWRVSLVGILAVVQLSKCREETLELERSCDNKSHAVCKYGRRDYFVACRITEEEEEEG